MTRLALSLTLLLAIAMLAPMARAQNTPPAAPKAPAAQPPAQPPSQPPSQPAAPDAQMQEMMKKMEEAGAPGPMHKLLEQRAGEWDMVWEFPNPMAPGTMERSTGSASVKSLFGGRFTSTTVQGTMMGQPFQGLDLTGYNNVTKKFESLWIDSMGTSMMFMTGTYDQATRTFTMHGEMADPMTGGATKVRTVYTMHEDKPHTFKMFTDDAAGEQLWMTVTYTRKPAAAAPAGTPKAAAPGSSPPSVNK